MTIKKFLDDDFVYVYPPKREVIGKVEWLKDGIAKKKEQIQPEENCDQSINVQKKKDRKRYYPWGSYRTMKRVFRIEGKEKEIENCRSLDDAISLAINEPYWD